MGKLLTVKDHILLSIGLVGDVLESLPFESYSETKRKLSMYGLLIPERSKRSYYSEVSRLLNTKMIEKVIRGKGKVYLQLSGSGKSEYKRRFSFLSMSRRKWDGYFMFVSYDIPEKRRGGRVSLREKLKELGFGMFQESVWISPYHFEDDMKEFIENAGLDSEVSVFSAKKLFGEDNKTLAQRVWNLEKLNENYQKVIELVSDIKKQKKMERENIKKATKIYTDTLIIDPFLPKELLFYPDLRTRAAEIIQKTF